MAGGQRGSDADGVGAPRRRGHAVVSDGAASADRPGAADEDRGGAGRVGTDELNGSFAGGTEARWGYRRSSNDPRQREADRGAHALSEAGSSKPSQSHSASASRRCDQTGRGRRLGWPRSGESRLPLPIHRMRKRAVRRDRSFRPARCATENSGGGGNRTHVRDRVKGSVYERSRHSDLAFDSPRRPGCRRPAPRESPDRLEQTSPSKPAI